MDRRRANLLLATLVSDVAFGCHRPTPPTPRVQTRIAAKPATRRSHAWFADQGDGTYRNPILYADYSDPDVLRVGNEYYLIASSFNCTPGLPILVSTDLVNWSFVGHALQNLPHPRYAEVQHGAGIWAPSLREHAGTFYVFAPTPDEGIYVLSAPHPRGPWSPPRMLLEGKGLIDPCPLWDDDGKAYLVHAYARSRAGIKDRLRVRPMAPDASAVLGEGEIVYSDPERQPTLEGPKFYKKDGRYYILAPAGGVEHGWQLALRAPSVYGPYEAKVVLERGSTSINGPHQGALVDTPSGQWWFVHFQQAGVYGRIVHLNPVIWQDGWPLMGEALPDGRRQPVLRGKKPDLPSSSLSTPRDSDEFESLQLSPAFQWHANHRSDWFSLNARPGFLRLFPRHAASFSTAPHLLLQKPSAPEFSLETIVELANTRTTTRAGLIVMGNTHAALSVSEAGGELVVRLWVNDAPVHEARIRSRIARLRLHFAVGGVCRFSYGSESGPLTSIENSFQATPGRWIGSKVGLFAISAEPTQVEGHADFDYFRFEPA